MRTRTTASGWWAVALLLALSASPSNSFLSAVRPCAGTAPYRYRQQRTCGSSAATALAMASGDTDGRGSRRAFLEGGAAAVLASVAALALPAPSLAKGFDVSEVKGLDVNEVMHLGAGDSGGKATKPLRDCLLSVERVRISTKQVRAALAGLGRGCSPLGLALELARPAVVRYVFVSHAQRHLCS